MRNKIPKELRPLYDIATEQNWKVSVTSKGHTQWKSPGKGIVHQSKTPSDHRSLKNFRSQLKRRGLRLTDGA